MNIILLSGGSGKRLWPLSNDSRSKQFLKVLRNDIGKPESMIQRVYRQISKNCDNYRIVVATGRNQYDSIVNQLGDKVEVVLEPERRDTFPAIALACSHLYYNHNLSLEDSVVIMPVDPYANDKYFDTLNLMYLESKKDNNDIVLMGIKPTYPSAKYGYIIPEKNTDSNVISVKKFAEKPTEENAKLLIESENALWNGGVFALKIKFIINKLKNYIDFNNFEDVFNKYSELKKISFDYEIVEKAKKIKAIPYDETWKDLGTWNTLTEVMADNSIGNVIKNDNCLNTHIINELKIPITVMGIHDAIIAASPDGILVSNKHESSYLKPYVEKIESIPMYGEKRWGEYKVLNYSSVDKLSSLTRLIRLNKDHSLSFHKHSMRDEIWNIIYGEAEIVIDGNQKYVSQGDTIKIPKNTLHGIKAITNIEMIEVQIGNEISFKDKKIENYEWK